MQNFTKTFLVFTVGAGLVLGVAAMAAVENGRLSVTQDEKTMEQTINRYLTDVHGRVVVEKVRAKNTNDVYLSIIIRGDTATMPNYQFIIDTQPLNKSATGQVIERGVRIDLFTDFEIPAAKRDEALKIINNFNRNNLFSAAFADVNGEVIFSWTLNVLADGLPTENVYDVLFRLQNLWRALQPKLAPLVK